MTLCLLLTAVASLYAQKFETSYGLPGMESGSDVAELSDGSIITVGTSDAYGAGANDMLVVKSSAGGTLLWAKYFGGSGDDAAMAVTIGPDDEIYVAGSTMNGTDKNGMLVKLNRHGQHLWTKTYGGALADEINDIGIRAGRVYMAGSSGNTGFQDMWFLKTDTAGILKENKTHGFAQNEQAQALAFTSDGNLVLSGRTGSFAGFNVYVVKMNLSGDTLWTKKFNLYLNAGTSTLPSGSGIAELSNQDLIVTGTGRDGIGNYSSTFHLRLGSAGNTLYTKWTSLLSDGGQDVAAGKNGSYYLLITSCNFGCPIVLKKFDLSGVETLYKTYQYPGGNSYATFASPGRMRVVSGARLLITGTSFLNANNADLYLARLDSNGVAYTNAAPGIIASGPLNFCSGGQVILSVPAGYAKYSWGRISQNQLSYPGGNNDSLLVNSGGSYFCTMWSSSGMRTTALVNVTVNPQPAASISASGPTAFCSGLGQSVALSVPSGFTTCQWNLNGSPVSGAVSSGYTATASGSYTVTVTNSCGTATSAPLSVNASVPPASSISCSGFYCYSGPAPCGLFPDPLSVTNYGAGATYQWYLNGNAYASGVFSLQPGYPAGNYTCTITTPCGTSTSAPYTVFAGPGFGIYEITSASQSSGCGVPASILLEAPFEGSSPFQWYLNGVLISGANASSYQASASGTYTVDFYEPNCMSMMGSEPFYCQLNTPARTISAAAGTSVCSGSVSLTASPAGAGIQYQWYRNNVMISGAISSVYPATTTGIYKCSINNPSCGSGFSNELAVNVGLPAPGIVISNATICSGQSSLVFCNPDYGSLYTYQWKLNNTNLPGANASSYAAGQAGNYTCVATNACGSATSNSVSLAVNALPPSAISYSGVASLCTGQSKVLTAPAGAGYAYQWYRNNAMLGGATLQSYTATSAASYTVRVTS
ncbi:MAG: hypothetical protein JNL88_01555, partial [Bacteroidia bacterium]|nr:hypothetical protein [Bacteroidia bacterium]